MWVSCLTHPLTRVVLISLCGCIIPQADTKPLNVQCETSGTNLKGRD